MPYDEPEPESRHRALPGHRRRLGPVPRLEWTGPVDYTVQRFRALLSLRQWRWWLSVVALVVLATSAFSDDPWSDAASAFRAVAVFALWFYLPYFLALLARAVKLWWRGRN